MFKVTKSSLRFFAHCLITLSFLFVLPTITLAQTTCVQSVGDFDCSPHCVCGKTCQTQDSINDLFQQCLKDGKVLDTSSCACVGGTTPVPTQPWSINTTAGNAVYNTSLSSGVGIGTATPNRSLHVASSTGNAEIDIQSGGKNYWALYHDSTSEQLRFWNSDVPGGNALIISNVGNVLFAGNAQINKSTAELLIGDNTAHTLRLVGAMTGASYIQVGVDGSDASGVLTVSRRNTTNSTISRLNVYSADSYFSGNFEVDGTSTLGSTVINGRTISFADGGSAWIGTQGSNVFALGTGNINRITIDGSGNVGIGTSSPAKKLGVTGDILASGDICTGSGKCLNTLTSADNLGNHTATQNIKLAGYWLSNDGGNEGVFVGIDGKVGVGTSTLTTKLSVAGDLSATGNMQINKGTADFILGNNTANTLRLVGAMTGTSYIQVGVDSSDATGVLTVSRRNTFNSNISKLNVYADSSSFSGEVKGAWLHANSTTGHSSISNVLSIGKSTAPATGYVLDVNGSAKISGNSSIMGSLGIGVESPTQKLVVQGYSGGSGFGGTDRTGGIRVRWPNGYGVGLDTWDGSNPRWGIVKYGSGNTGTVIMEGVYSSNDVIFNGGNVGIGITPTSKLHVYGDITGSGEINGQYLHINGAGGDHNIAGNIYFGLSSTDHLASIKSNGEINGQFLHIKGNGDNDIIGNLLVKGLISVQDSSGLNGKIQIKKTPSTTALPPCEEGNRGEVRFKECTTVGTKCKDRLVVCAWHDNELFGGGDYVWLSVSWKDVVAQ